MHIGETIINRAIETLIFGNEAGASLPVSYKRNYK